MYAQIYEQGGHYYADTQGCGCCGDTVELTPETLREHISDLKEELARAEAMLNRMEAA